MVQRFLEQARARKLDRVAAAYAVVAWLAVQGASIAFPAFAAPGWALQAVIVVAVIGLPAALAIAWHLARPAGSAEPFRRLRRFDTALLVLLGVVVAMSAVQLALSFVKPDRTAAAPAPRPASIAVLPFVNMSGDPAREYFSDGISEEILNSLANMSDLKVAARTSSFAFKRRNVDVKEIGRILNVSAVLEGSVREEDGKVRITAQLIDTTNGYHLWSRSYDRELTGILAVQEEIARDITVALTHRLAAARPRAGRPGEIDPEAYRKYLEANFLLVQRTEDSINRAVTLFGEAARAEPQYADAQAGLAMAHAIRAFNFVKPADIAPAEAAVARARALEPHNITALMADAMVALLRWDWRRAAADIRNARAAAPRNAVVLHYASVVYSTLDLDAPALAAVRGALALDPLSFIDRNNLALYLINTGKLDEALPAIDAALKLSPGNTDVISLKCRVYALKGNVDKVREVANAIAQLDAGQPSSGGQDCAFRIALVTRNTRAALAVLNVAIAQLGSAEFGATDIGAGYQLLGDIDKAVDWYERAYRQREPSLLATPSMLPYHEALTANPRWRALQEKPDVKAWKQTRDEVARELAAGG